MTHSTAHTAPRCEFVQLVTDYDGALVDLECSTRAHVAVFGAGVAMLACVDHAPALLDDIASPVVVEVDDLSDDELAQLTEASEQ